MKQRLEKVKEDTIIRLDGDYAYIYTVDSCMRRYMEKIEAEPFVKDWNGKTVEWKAEKSHIALV